MILSYEEIEYLKEHANEFLAEGVEDSVLRETLKSILDLIETLEFTKYDYDRRIAVAKSHIQHNIQFGIDGVLNTICGEDGYGYSKEGSMIQFESQKKRRMKNE